MLSLELKQIREYMRWINCESSYVFDAYLLHMHPPVFVSTFGNIVYIILCLVCWLNLSKGKGSKMLKSIQ